MSNPFGILTVRYSRWASIFLFLKDIEESKEKVQFSSFIYSLINLASLICRCDVRVGP